MNRQTEDTLLLPRNGRLTVNIERLSLAQFRASCPSLVGCVAYGQSIAQVKQRMAQAITSYLASRDVFLLLDPLRMLEFHEG